MTELKLNHLMRVMLAGPSGIGKTTLARWLSEVSGVKFISGSMSNLLPETKDITHHELLSENNKKLILQDYQLISVRHRVFGTSGSYITDRSYLDSAAYFIYKQSKFESNCTLSDFIYTCKQLICSDCDVIILLSLDNPLDFMIEDNHKRITNSYFQVQISKLCEIALKVMGYRETLEKAYIDCKWWNPIRKPLSKPYRVGYINHPVSDKPIKVVIIPNLVQNEREEILKEVLY